MSTPKRPSLAEFAAAKAPPPCRVCVIPERPEIDEGLRAGIPRRFILEWLWETKGYTTSAATGVSENSLDKHAKGRHHYKEG